MKTFKFEIVFTENDLTGDEFWNDAIQKDGTGIADLTEALICAIEDSNIMVNSDRDPKDVVRLISYADDRK